METEDSFQLALNPLASIPAINPSKSAAGTTTELLNRVTAFPRNASRNQDRAAKFPALTIPLASPAT